MTIESNDIITGPYTFSICGTGTAPTPTPTPAPTPTPTPAPEPEQAKPNDNGAKILVNGKPETGATVVTTKAGDNTVTTYIVDDKKVEEVLNREGSNAVITLPVIGDADVVVGQLNGQTVKSMEDRGAVLEVQTSNAIYRIPAAQIDIDNISEQLGRQVDLKDATVNVKISEPSEDTVRIIEDTASKNGYQIMVEPIAFEITCSIGNETVEVSTFSVYVERLIAIPEGVDPSKITTGIIVNSDGTFTHVPTSIVIIDGKYYAKINSLTNSTYLLISSPKAFKDVEGHWAEQEINDLGSRLIVSGIGNDNFGPDRDITRAEFATIVIKALGLLRPGAGRDIFLDVTADNWYYDAVSIAYEYGIISGYGNGKFGPDDKITREQAMTMITKAMRIADLKVELADGEAEKLLAGYTDAGSAADYAKVGIASCVKAGLIPNRIDKLIAPKAHITRAEMAVMVHRLLRNAKLI